MERTFKDTLLDFNDKINFEQEIILVQVASIGVYGKIFAVKRNGQWVISSDRMGTCYMFEDGEFGYRGGLREENPNSYPTLEDAIAAFYAIYKPKTNDDVIRVGDRVVNCMGDKWTGTVTKIEPVEQGIDGDFWIYFITDHDGKEWREIIETFEKIKE